MNPLRRNLASAAVIATCAAVGILLARASGANAPMFIGTFTSDAGTNPGGPPTRYVLENGSIPAPDAAYDDAAAPENDPNPGPGVLDTKTGLTWQQYSVYETTFPAAQAYCANLTPAGSVPWRVPAINELLTLINFEYNNGQATGGTYGAGPLLDQTAFPVVEPPTNPPGSSEYWSMTPQIGAPGNIWMFDFNTGTEPWRTASGDATRFWFRIRCVHS